MALSAGGGLGRLGHREVKAGRPQPGGKSMEEASTGADRLSFQSGCLPVKRLEVKKDKQRVSEEGKM